MAHGLEYAETVGREFTDKDFAQAQREGKYGAFGMLLRADIDRSADNNTATGKNVQELEAILASLTLEYFNLAVRLRTGEGFYPGQDHKPTIERHLKLEKDIQCYQQELNDLRLRLRRQVQESEAREAQLMLARTVTELEETIKRWLFRQHELRGRQDTLRQQLHATQAEIDKLQSEIRKNQKELDRLNAPQTSDAALTVANTLEAKSAK